MKKLVLIVHNSGRLEMLSEDKAFLHYRQFVEDFQKHGYVIPTSNLYPCFYTVESFVVNGKKTASRRAIFSVAVDSFSVVANGEIYNVGKRAARDLFEEFIEGKRAKLWEAQKALEAMRAEIESHEDRAASLY